MRNSDQEIRTAYAECRKLARRHYENFPVASRLVPPDKRDALAAIYAFARGADDFADEPKAVGAIQVRCRDSGGVHRTPAIGESPLQALADWRARLEACCAGNPRPNDTVFIALADAVRCFGLSKMHLVNLLEAFESDVRSNRHPNFESLLAYCSCSANPVGRLVLELFGHRDRRLFELSDHICTALQLTNFWQDVGVDLARDRVYLPMEDLARFDVSLDDLRTGQLDGRFRSLMAFEVARTRNFFDLGRGLPEEVVPELRRQLRLTWLGGWTILERMEAANFDVFNHRPQLTRMDFARLYWRARRPLGAASGPPTMQAGREQVEPAGASRTGPTRTR